VRDVRGGEKTKKEKRPHILHCVGKGKKKRGGGLLGGVDHRQVARCENDLQFCGGFLEHNKGGKMNIEPPKARRGC